MSNGHREVSGTGWSVFSGVFLFIAGLFNVMNGLVALLYKGYFNEGALVYENLQAWGWTYVVVGALQLIIGWLVLSRSSTGRWLGVVFATLSLLVSFFAIGAFPLWAIMTMVVDGVVLYGLTARWES